jgi:hypothetical protein
MRTRKTEAVRLFNAALDDDSDSNSGVVLRGSLCIDTLVNLLHADYQRDIQPDSSQEHILDALANGDRLPDVDLGMRGESFHENKDGVVTLKDPTYIIDGLQRISTIIKFAERQPETPVRIGATVHFNTTYEREKDRFFKLNNWRNKLSPNVLLRNMRDKNHAILALYGLTHAEKSFPLYGRVSWQQRMKKGEMITAATLAKVAGMLHSHKGPGRSSRIEELADALNRTVPIVGPQIFRDNLRTFFGIVDKAWGISRVQYREGAIYMRHQFLNTLAMVLSEHLDFWQSEDRKLVVDAKLLKKLASFPVADPEVLRLAAGTNMARESLFILLVRHLNSGKRTRRLRPRNAQPVVAASDDDECGEVA